MMKKIAIIGVVVVLVAAVLLLSQFVPSLQEKKSLLGGEYEKVLRHLERTYPEKIKLVYVKTLSMWGPLTKQRADTILKENLLVKDRLSTNTYHIDDSYEYINGKFTRYPDIRGKNIKEILAAKNDGLSIRLSSSLGYRIPQFKNIDEVKEFLDKYSDVLVDEASFAEKYKIEYFSLFEPDHLILSQRFPVDDDTTAEIVNNFKEDVIPRIKQVYNGKIEYQIGNADVWNFTKLNVSGLDHFGVLIGGMCDFELFKEKVDEIFSKAENLSESYNVPWVISELWINKKYDEEGNTCDLTGKRTRYYNYVFEKSRTSKNLVGIMIDTWNVDEPRFETSVKGTSSEQTIKEFFESWN